MRRRPQPLKCMLLVYSLYEHTWGLLSGTPGVLICEKLVFYCSEKNIRLEDTCVQQIESKLLSFTLT